MFFCEVAEIYRQWHCLERVDSENANLLVDLTHLVLISGKTSTTTEYLIFAH